MNKIFRNISLLLVIVGLSAPVYAKRNTYNISGVESSGFNGLDYVLQKPLGNETFPRDEKGFFKHIFIGASGGVSMKGDNFTTLPRPGLNLDGQVGSWFTPIHGIRIVGGGGFLSVHQGVRRTWYASGHLDYMLNLSYLLRGYNPYRMFELIGTVGPEFQLIRFNEAWHKSLGLGASLQMRFNVNPAMYLFMEPRFSVLTRYNYDGQFDLYRMRTYATLNLGLGYRILYGKYRAAGSTDFKQSKDDNLYVGVGAGLWTFSRGSIKLNNISANIYIGKMFSSTSGLQLNIGAGQKKDNVHNGYFGVGTLDYVLNLDNAFGGYRPNQFFNMMMNIGVGGGIAHRNVNETFSPALSAGLTALFNLSPNWALTLHPQMYVFRSSFNQMLVSSFSPLTSVDLGVRYTTGNFTTLHPVSYEVFNRADAKKWFITAGAGLGRRINSNFGYGGNMNVGFGKRFTPISSWRLSVNGDIFPHYPVAIDITGNLDYLSSITTAMYGYDPERLFDLQLMIGAMGGLSNYVGSLKPVLGLKAGLQASFRLSKHLDIFVEPHLIATNTPYVDGMRIWTPELRGNIGLTYRLGTPKDGRGKISETPYSDHRFFAGISAGPSMYAGWVSRNNLNLSGVFDLSVGRWFSMVSGLRFMYSNDWTPFLSKKDYFGSAHVDYLLNVTSLIDRSAARRFHIIGSAGVGLGISPKGARTTGAMAYGGVQFRYNLPYYNLDVHLEPGATFWAARLMPSSLGYPHRFSLGARITAGVSYRF